MSMFIKVIDQHEDNYHEVERVLAQHFGYNDCYWRKDRDSIQVYYKDIHIIQHLIR
jgi:phage-related protein